jgi:hypothetical protein
VNLAPITYFIKVSVYNATLSTLNKRVIYAVILCSHKMFALIVSQLQRLPVLNAKDTTLILKCQNALNVNLSVILQHWPNVKAVTNFGILKRIIAI